MKNNLPNHILIPKPEIRFEGKHQLKRRTIFGAIAWAGSAVAAMLIVGGVFYFDRTPDDVCIWEVASVVETIEQTTDIIDNQPFKDDKSNNKPTQNKAKQPTLKMTNKVTTPPPVAQPQTVDPKLQKVIQSERKREKLPQISISPKTVFATVTKTKIDIASLMQRSNIETIAVTKPEQRERNFIANSNLSRVIENIKNDIEERKYDKAENMLRFELSPTLKSLFEPKKRSATLISKTEE